LERRFMHIFSTVLSLRWRDLDAYGHVNNASYLTLFEETRILWFATLAEPWRSAHAEPVVARTEVDYRRAMHYPAELRSALFIDRIGNTSLTLRHTLTEAHDSSLLYAEGKTVLVWINPETQKSAPLPDFVRAGCISQAPA
jgi:acyl-CoA thioester hydrolase